MPTRTASAPAELQPGSCARATSASESRYRIDRPIAPSRAARIFALDDGAAEALVPVAELEWARARFYRLDGELHLLGGGSATLADELASASVAVMVMTADSGTHAAYDLGRACYERGVQTAGLVLAEPGSRRAETAAAALRPHARVLLPTASELDLVDLLTALRV